MAKAVETNASNSALWIRKKNRLQPKDSNDYLKIVKSNGIYLETVVCQDNVGFQIEFRQVSPSYYLFSKELG
jgi:hypothetical protein